MVSWGWGGGGVSKGGVDVGDRHGRRVKEEGMKGCDCSLRVIHTRRKGEGEMTQIGYFRQGR